VAFDVVRRKVVWRAVSPAPFWAGAVATSSGLVFTGDMRGYFMALDARTGSTLYRFQTGSGIAGSPITYELDGTQYVAVPSGGISGDMTFYYKEPKGGALWVFALEGGPAVGESAATNLVTREGSLPKVGEPGSTLGGRVLPGYGFPAGEGREPVKGEAPPQPTSASSEPAAGVDMVAQGEQLYRARCFGCHLGSGGSGPTLFRTTLTPSRFKEAVAKGKQGTTMPAFGGLLSTEEIWAVYEFLLARDRLQ
jgi:cytochrome c5